MVNGKTSVDFALGKIKIDINEGKLAVVWVLFSVFSTPHRKEASSLGHSPEIAKQTGVKWGGENGK